MDIMVKPLVKVQSAVAIMELNVAWTKSHLHVLTETGNNESQSCRGTEVKYAS